jgi:hypothetical protein
MSKYISPLTICLTVCLTAATGYAERIDPFALQAITPELTGESWSKFLGVGLNIRANPQRTGNTKTFNTNLWYTLGKGNPFLADSIHTHANKHELLTTYGTIVAESQSLSEYDSKIVGAPYALTIDYALSLPMNPQDGLSFLSVSCNTPTPALEVGQSISVGVWIKRTTPVSPLKGLQMVGHISTFGGDIFTEQIMRLMLSHQPPTMRYLPPTYEVKTVANSITVGADRLPEVLPKLTNVQRVHSADSPRGMEARQGFVLGQRWQYVQSQPFTVSDWDIQSGVISFELMIQMPFSAEAQDKGTTWAPVEGNLKLAGFEWWLEK